MSWEGQRLYSLPRVGETRAEAEPTVIQVTSCGMQSHRHRIIYIGVAAKGGQKEQRP